jgi:hypothetical protein
MRDREPELYQRFTEPDGFVRYQLDLSEATQARAAVGKNVNIESGG